MGKYFKYAIGEILLVVFGILIALQINNWNERKKQKEIEISYLKRLQIDLNEHEKLWIETKKRKQNQIEASYKFLKFSFSKNKDTVLKIMPYFETIGSWEDININQITFNEMVNSGKLDVIRNDSIKIKLQQLDIHYKDILNWDETLEVEHRVRLHESVMKILSTRFVIPMNKEQSAAMNLEFSPTEIQSYATIFKKDFIKLFDDKTFLNGVFGIQYNNKDQLTYIKKLNKDLKELQVLISNEIKVLEK